MQLLEAIHTRRSIGKVQDTPVEREKIEQLLEAATWAPNHHKTEPWKFFVLTGEGRRPLGRTLADIAAVKMEDPSTPENQETLERQKLLPFRAPVVIAAAAIPSDDPKAVHIEEIGAVNAAIQNMLLAAHSLGLGAVWRTGLPTYHPKMKELFKLREQDEVLGFIYIGYPDMTPKPGTRIPFAEKTVWIEEDQL
ncbi:nitroreductase family protein [Paenibacillus sp. 1001270B_150601_E10]|uniref:nitroreductase family protein n=1 Tax=Paenibacillus sp. 1001270B_150601_E10 TaxID=2787079 RepID=UPI00189ECDC7|nr:nitroreductase [Paenibacillus sp. 1001270B_150601_E10]